MNRCDIFVDDIDRQHHYYLLCDAVNTHGMRVHAYVFMGNHIHLLLTSAQTNVLSRAMRNTGPCHVRVFNRRYHRSGTIWQGRFKSCLVDTERYVVTVYRYIELYPVRAATVEVPEQHRRSSIHSNLGLLIDPLLTAHSVYLKLDHDAAIRAAIYRTWIHECVVDDDLQRIRTHLQKERAHGDTSFQNIVEKAIGHPVEVRQRGRPTSGKVSVFPTTL